jgi:hypothetical protein
MDGAAYAQCPTLVGSFLLRKILGYCLVEVECFHNYLNGKQSNEKIPQGKTH